MDTRRRAAAFGCLIGLPVATADTAGFGLIYKDPAPGCRSALEPIGLLGRIAPAPGNRSIGEGVLYLIGQGGYGWAAAADSGYARYLGFLHGGINPQNSNYRAFGFQVRCLLE